jgi:hypothetical protein
VSKYRKHGATKKSLYYLCVFLCYSVNSIGTAKKGQNGNSQQNLFYGPVHPVFFYYLVQISGWIFNTDWCMRWGCSVMSYIACCIYNVNKAGHVNLELLCPKFRADTNMLLSLCSSFNSNEYMPGPLSR